MADETQPVTSRRRRFWNRPVVVCAAAVALTAAVHLLAPWWWLADIGTQFAVQCVLLPAPLVLLAMGARRWSVALFLAVPLVIHAWLVSGYFPVRSPLLRDRSPQVRTDARDEDSVRVMTLNVRRSNNRYDDVVELVREWDPDILALQEVDREWMDALAELNEGWPHRRFEQHPGNFGIAVISRRPWEAIDVQWFGEFELPSIHVRFRAGDIPFEFVTIHPMPPTARKRAAMRNAQLLLTAEGLDSGRSRIVAGDFNLTPWSPWFREFLRRGKVVDSARGFSLAPTWHSFPTWLGGVKIDHVLVSPDWMVDNYRVGPDVGSDHRAVVVDLRPARKQPDLTR